MYVAERNKQTDYSENNTEIVRRLISTNVSVSENRLN